MKPKKDYENKQEINTENYLTKKSVKKKREYGRNRYQSMSEEINKKAKNIPKKLF